MPGLKKISFFKGTHLSNAGIALYADGIALKKVNLLPKDILDHVEDCMLCRDEVFATHEAIKNEDYLTDGHKHPFFSRKIESITKKRYLNIFWIPLAASIVIIFGLVLFLFQRSENAKISLAEMRLEKTKNREEKLVKKNTTTENNSNIRDKIASDESEKIKIAQNNDQFKTNDVFESMMESGNRGDQFEVYAPAINTEYAQDITIEFKWSDPENGLIDLIIFNNKSQKVFVKNRINSNTYKVTKHLNPGLYYWKIIQNDEILNVGKFIIH